MKSAEPTQPIAFIRRDVFGATQAEFAAIAGVSQGTVCKWERGMEKGGFRPGHEHMERIRAAATKRGLPWNDQWFWEFPRAETLPQTPEPAQ